MNNLLISDIEMRKYIGKYIFIPYDSYLIVDTYNPSNLLLENWDFKLKYFSNLHSIIVFGDDNLISMSKYFAYKLKRPLYCIPSSLSSDIIFSSFSIIRKYVDNQYVSYFSKTKKPEIVINNCELNNFYGFIQLLCYDISLNDWKEKKWEYKKLSDLINKYKKFLFECSIDHLNSSTLFLFFKCFSNALDESKIPQLIGFNYVLAMYLENFLSRIYLLSERLAFSSLLVLPLYNIDINEYCSLFHKLDLDLFYFLRDFNIKKFLLMINSLENYLNKYKWIFLIHNKLNTNLLIKNYLNIKKEWD